MQSLEALYKKCLNVHIPTVFKRSEETVSCDPTADEELVNVFHTLVTNPVISLQVVGLKTNDSVELSFVPSDCYFTNMFLSKHTSEWR